MWHYLLLLLVWANPLCVLDIYPAQPQNLNIRSDLMTAFVLEITTVGSDETVVIPTSGSGYSYDIDWDDGDSDLSQTAGNPTHVYSAAGTYEVAISGTFPYPYYNNGTYKTQPTAIIQWGDENTWSTSLTSSFYGCSNLIGSIPDDDAEPLASLTDGRNMFRDISISGSLPTGMTLASLTNGRFMFYNTPISGSLPTGMTLASLTDGRNMFRGTSISGSLPIGMILASVDDGGYMFYNTSISGSLPTGMTLASLTNGYNMFYNTSISGSLPTGMTLASLTDGYSMFYNTSISELPTGMTLASLTEGTNMFSGTTINTASYSDLLVAMEAATSETGVTFHGGNATYNASAVSARASLVADSWVITDGGLAAAGASMPVFNQRQYQHLLMR